MKYLILLMLISSPVMSCEYIMDEVEEIRAEIKDLTKLKNETHDDYTQCIRDDIQHDEEDSNRTEILKKMSEVETGE